MFKVIDGNDITEFATLLETINFIESANGWEESVIVRPDGQVIIPELSWE